MKKRILYMAILAALGSASIARAQSTTASAVFMAPVASSPNTAMFAPPPEAVTSLPATDEPAWIQLTGATVETDAVDAEEDEPAQESRQVKVPLRDPWVGADGEEAPVEPKRVKGTLISLDDPAPEEVSPGTKPESARAARHRRAARPPVAPATASPRIARPSSATTCICGRITLTWRMPNRAMV